MEHKLILFFGGIKTLLVFDFLAVPALVWAWTIIPSNRLAGMVVPSPFIQLSTTWLISNCITIRHTAHHLVHQIIIILEDLLIVRMSFSCIATCCGKYQCFQWVNVDHRNQIYQEITPRVQLFWIICPALASEKDDDCFY